MPLYIIVQDINTQYAYVNYLNMRVMICKENTYINMTKVVNMFETRDGNEKELKHWFNNQSSKELIEYLMVRLSSKTGEPSRPLYYTNIMGSFETRGTYCHKLLVPHILNWCSPIYAFEFSKCICLHENDIEVNTSVISKRITQTSDEYERLKNSSDQQDKEFLAEMEAAEDF
jgi:hypothetical protein